MKKAPIIFSFITLMLLLVNCSKKDDASPDNDANKPTLTTTAVYDITKSTASSGGQITSTGSSAITACGICWSTNQNPDTTANKTKENPAYISSGYFGSDLTGLTKNTTYYVRAYAVNSSGISYGDQQTFTTLSVTNKATGTVSFKADGTEYSFAIDTLQTETNGFLLEAKGASILDGYISLAVYSSNPISTTTTYTGDNGGIITLYNNCFYQAAAESIRPGSSLSIKLSTFSLTTSIQGTFSGTAVLYMGTCNNTTTITNGIINCTITQQP